MSALSSFLARVGPPADNGCWPWIGAVSTGGYGRYMVNGKQKNAHRVVWTILHGPIPDGMVAMHLCDNRPCVNPAHIIVGTPRDNTLDMFAKGRSGARMKPLLECRRGHAFTPENTIINGNRRCRICRRVADTKAKRAWRLARRIK